MPRAGSSSRSESVPGVGAGVVGDQLLRLNPVIGVKASARLRKPVTVGDVVGVEVDVGDPSLVVEDRVRVRARSCSRRSMKSAARGHASVRDRGAWSPVPCHASHVVLAHQRACPRSLQSSHDGSFFKQHVRFAQTR